MPFAITGSRLAKFDVDQGADGRTCSLELDVDYTGDYDALAAAAVASLTPEGYLSPIATAYGSELGAPGSGIFCSSKRATWKSPPAGTLPGEYTLALGFTEGNVIAENPLDRKDTIAWSRVAVPTTFYKDADGKPVVTAAKEVYASLPTVGLASFSCTISGFRAGYSELRFATDKYNVVNSDALNLKGIVVAARKARYLSCTTSDEIINGYPCVRYTWALDFKDDWDFKPLHLGNYELKAGKSVRIVDSLGLMRQTPWPLTAAGVALPDDYLDTAVVSQTYKATVDVDFGASFGWAF